MMLKFVNLFRYNIEIYAYWTVTKSKSFQAKEIIMKYTTNLENLNEKLPLTNSEFDKKYVLAIQQRSYAVFSNLLD